MMFSRMCCCWRLYLEEKVWYRTQMNGTEALEKWKVNIRIWFCWMLWCPIWRVWWQDAWRWSRNRLKFQIIFWLLWTIRQVSWKGFFPGANDFISNLSSGRVVDPGGASTFFGGCQTDYFVRLKSWERRCSKGYLYSVIAHDLHPRWPPIKVVTRLWWASIVNRSGTCSRCWKWPIKRQRKYFLVGQPVEMDQASWVNYPTFRNR